MALALISRKTKSIDFEAERRKRPPAPPYAEHPKSGDFSVGVTGGPKFGWEVYLYKYGKAMWIVENHLVGPFSLEIEAVMACREEANRRGLPRSF